MASVLKRASSFAAFEKAPAGQYLAGPSWIHAAIEPDLFVVLLFGRPNEDDMRALVRSLRVELADHIEPHRSLVDAEHLAGVDLGAFEVLKSYVTERRAQLSEKVTRLALVRPSGLEGAVVAGFFQVLEAPYPVEVVEHARAGLDWLDQNDAEALSETLSDIADKELGASPTVSALQAYLADHLEDAAVEEASRGLGLSPRTLQRRLEAADTTFQKELIAARLDAAERRMLDSDAPLTAIAIDAGFATLQHFSAAFRRKRGVSPREWRRANRKL